MSVNEGQVPAVRGEGRIARLIQPQDFQGAWAIAEKLCLSEIIPKNFKPKVYKNASAEERALAIQVAASNIVLAWEMGAEVGLSPMAALQSIAVINGKPTLYGEAPLAVVWASGKLESIEESLDEEKKIQTCTVKRVGVDKPVTRTFSMAEADAAEMWETDSNGNGAWKKLSARAAWRSWWRDMLMYRARGRVLKALFPDVLKGVDIQEASLDTGEPESGAIIDITPEGEVPNPFAPKRVAPKEPDVAPAVVEPVEKAPAARKPKAAKVVVVEAPPAVEENPAVVAAEATAAAEASDDVPAVGTEDCDKVGPHGEKCWGPRGHEDACLYEPTEEGAAGPTDEAPADLPAPFRIPDDMAAPEAHLEFVLYGKKYRTAGMTEAQMKTSFDIAPNVDKAMKAKGPQYSREMLGKILGKPAVQSSRVELNSKQAAVWLEAMDRVLKGEEVAL